MFLMLSYNDVLINYICSRSLFLNQKLQCSKEMEGEPKVVVMGNKATIAVQAL